METFAEKIITAPLFLKLKIIIENNPWHDHESAYDHLIKTHRIAGEQISGDFITDPKAKNLFLKFVNEDLDGFKRKDIMLITALVHDIGKALFYKDGDHSEQPLRHEDTNGITKFPGHEYWSSTLVPDLLKDTGLSEKNIGRIASVVRLHNTFNDDYLKGLSTDIESAVDDMKARAEGLEIEALFNIYCDEFTAEISQDAKAKMVEVFNTPSFYAKREYFIK